MLDNAMVQAVAAVVARTMIRFVTVHDGVLSVADDKKSESALLRTATLSAFLLEE